MDETLKLARLLELQSIVTGTRPRAMINNKLIAPGEWIEGFELIEVTDRSVQLKRNGFVIRLWM